MAGLRRWDVLGHLSQRDHEIHPIGRLFCLSAMEGHGAAVPGRVVFDPRNSGCGNLHLHRDDERIVAGKASGMSWHVQKWRPQNDLFKGWVWAIPILLGFTESASTI